MADIQYNYDGDEVPASLTLLTLRRADTGADVTLPSPATFTENPAGTFTISFDEPTPGLTYLYTYRRTWDDGIYDPPEADSVQGTTGSYAGRYTTQAAVRTWLGTINADVLADLDGDGAADAGAWQQAVTWGEDELDLYASGGPADVPLTYTGGTADQQGVAARVVQRWATVLAGWHLFYKRPAAGGNLIATPLAAQVLATLDGAKKAVLSEIQRWRAGELLLPGLTPVAAAADDTPEPGQFQFVAIDRGTGCDGDEFSSCW